MFRTEYYFYTLLDEVKKALIYNNPATPLDYTPNETPSPGQFSFNNTTKEIYINDTATHTGRLFQKVYAQTGDVVEIEFELFYISGSTPQIGIDYMGGNASQYYSTNANANKWEKYKITHLIEKNADYYRISIGTMTPDVGLFKIRNIGFKLRSKSTANTGLNIERKSLKKYAITKPAGTSQFSLRTNDFANDVGVLSQVDNNTLRIDFDSNNLFTKRPVVLVSETGYGDSVKYRAKPYDVYTNYVTIKLFNSNNTIVDLSAIPSAENIFIHVLATE